MAYIEKANRGQGTLLPDRIEDYVGEDNPVRVIDAFVDSLSLLEMGFTKAIPADTGRPPYDPRDLLKLYIYGYLNKIRSSRKLMLECGRNIEVMYLLSKLTPDFRTIANFRRDNAKALRNVFRAFVKLCSKLGLYQKTLLAVDGTKIRAQNGDDHAFNKDILEKKLARIDEHISSYLSVMDTADKNEADEKIPSAAEIKKILSGLNKRKEKYEGYLDYLSENGDTQILETDPEARRMHSKDGFHCCYNVQTAVDGGSHLIADYEVTNHNTDQGLLNQVSTQAKELLEVKTIEAVADKGYESRADILNCVMNGTVPNVALKYDKNERVFSLDYIANDITNTERNSTDPETIQKCIHAGVLPACYEGTALSLELQMETKFGCFSLLPNNTVICPMGNILSQVRYREKRGTRVYGNRGACRQCTNRCTRSNKPKFVEFGENTQHITARMYGSTPVKNSLPEDGVLNQNNHILDRKNPKPGKVMLTIRPDKEKLHQRMCLSEHPFGTVKWYDGAHYVLCRGKEKASAELGLSFLAYNLRRVLNILGTTALLKEIEG